MYKKDYKAINEAFIDERTCGHNLCDFDDEYHDLGQIAELIGIEMIYNDEEDYFEFKNTQDEKRCREALEYYYSLH